MKEEFVNRERRLMVEMSEAMKKFKLAVEVLESVDGFDSTAIRNVDEALGRIMIINCRHKGLVDEMEKQDAKEKEALSDDTG